MANSKTGYKELHIPNKEVANAFADEWNKANGGGTPKKKASATTKKATTKKAAAKCKK